MLPSKDQLMRPRVQRPVRHCHVLDCCAQGAKPLLDRREHKQDGITPIGVVTLLSSWWECLVEGEQRSTKRENIVADQIPSFKQGPEKVKSVSKPSVFGLHVNFAQGISRWTFRIRWLAFVAASSPRPAYFQSFRIVPMQVWRRQAVQARLSSFAPVPKMSYLLRRLGKLWIVKARFNL